MKLARYLGGGRVAIVEEPEPSLPAGGLLVRTEVCGLCSGELMSWYMDAKVPHVLGHEVAGIVEGSEDLRFPPGTRVFVHHHAPCGSCEACERGHPVHCKTWQQTKLVPGGMAEMFAVAPENLSDTIPCDDLRPQDVALIEPLACVAKSLRRGRLSKSDRVAIIGLGSLGLAHALAILGDRAPTIFDLFSSENHQPVVGYETSVQRREYAKELGIEAREPVEATPADLVFVCPGNESAIRLALEIAAPGARIVLFAPFQPDRQPVLDLNFAYFRDLELIASYSCGPEDTRQALQWIRQGRVKAEQLVSDFIRLEDVPSAYEQMRDGAILKAMVMFE